MLYKLIIQPKFMFRHTSNKQMKYDESNCLHTDTHTKTYIKLTNRPFVEH